VNDQRLRHQRFDEPASLEEPGSGKAPLDETPINLAWGLVVAFCGGGFWTLEIIETGAPLSQKYSPLTRRGFPIGFSGRFPYFKVWQARRRASIGSHLGHVRKFSFRAVGVCVPESKAGRLTYWNSRPGLLGPEAEGVNAIAEGYRRKCHEENCDGCACYDIYENGSGGLQGGSPVRLYNLARSHGR
jgi:hypothetical protein